MSCNYPHCGCSFERACTTIPEDMEKSKNSQSFGELFRKALPGNKVLVIENETSFDIERIKRNELNEYERIERGACSVRPKRKHASNYTPPKKRHRK